MSISLGVIIIDDVIKGLSQSWLVMDQCGAMQQGIREGETVVYLTFHLVY